MLYSELERYSKEYENFAYICKFDMDTRLSGQERLFLSGEKPVFAENSVKSMLDEARRKMISQQGSDRGPMPFFVGYDSIPEFYPVGSIKKSRWPMAAAIIPEKALEGNFQRELSSAIRGKVEHSFNDAGMLEKIKELKERIISGELLQVVLSRRFDLSDIDPFALLQHFMEGDRSLYVYYYRMGEFEIIGSSPENVISRNGRLLEVHPIAGTIRRGENDSEDVSLAGELMSNPKELREHRMLVDLARNDLGVLSEPGSVRVVKSMEVQKFASVQHIVSRVQSNLSEDMGNYDIIKSVFPAGTVSGAPKIRAIKLIEEYEEYPRGPYSGGLGLMSKDTLDMALLIRSVYRSPEETYTQAGGGIVMDSVPEREVKEYYSKAATVMGGVRSASVDY